MFFFCSDYDVEDDNKAEEEEEEKEVERNAVFSPLNTNTH